MEKTTIFDSCCDFTNMNSWYKSSYARLLIDNHISEDDPSFMAKFDPAGYVSLVKSAGIDAAMVYACCHNGNCYYPTKVGHMHANLHGRDIFGETVTLLRQTGITPVAYYTTIYHNHSAKTHPDWRMQDITGAQHDGRYWWSCPNSADYREFTKVQISEVITYEVDGIFIDMTFWPVICYCPNCRKRYQQETGLELPVELNWRDPEWVRFQRFRQRTMASFTQDITNCVKSQRDITVTYQSSLIIQGYMMGQNNGVADASDYTSGDFYGGKYQHILGAKVLSSASKNHPYEFMTSRCVNLNDHTSMKSEAEMCCEAATTLANGGAAFFIDAINPDGTLEQAVYGRLGKVIASLTPFTQKLKELQPVITASTGIYLSMVSHIDEKLNCTSIKLLVDNPWKYSNTPPVEELMGVSTLLAQTHHPYRVVRNDADLSGLSGLIINDARFMDVDEANRIRNFVRSGGTLIATGLTSLLDVDGTLTKDFLLADVLGVSYSGQLSKRVNYLCMNEGINPPQISKMISSNRPSPMVRATTAKVLAYLVEPLFDPDDRQHWASIHSNPPGRITEYAALTENQYGKGKCVYLAPATFGIPHDAQKCFGTWLMEQYFSPGIVISTNAPPCVEITILKSTIKNVYLLCFVNYQRELPNIMVRDLSTRIKLPLRYQLVSIRRVSDGAKVDIEKESDEITIEVPCLNTIEMFALEYR
jgi:hypothetical protein